MSRQQLVAGLAALTLLAICADDAEAFGRRRSRCTPCPCPAPVTCAPGYPYAAAAPGWSSSPHAMAAPMPYGPTGAAPHGAPEAMPRASGKLTYSQVKGYVEANNQSDLSTELLICLIWKESGFDPNATSGSSTATGLMQMTKGAVDDVNKNTPQGVHFEHSDMKNAVKNIQCGTWYLKILIKRWGSTKAGLEHFGTGAGYADNILTCEKCIKATPAKPQPCLNAIHP